MSQWNSDESIDHDCFYSLKNEPVLVPYFLSSWIPLNPSHEWSLDQQAAFFVQAIVKDPDLPVFRVAQIHWHDQHHCHELFRPLDNHRGDTYHISRSSMALS
jgi:hypothetical protein